MARAAAQMLLLSALLGVIIASACAPPAAIERTGPAAAGPVPVVPTESVVTTEILLPDGAPPASDAEPTVPTEPDSAAPQSVPDAAAPFDPLPNGPDAAVTTDASAGRPDVSGSDAAAVDLAPVKRRVVFLVLDPLDPAPGEWRMRRRLEARGFSVDFVVDTTLAKDVTGAALVLISASTRGWMVLDHMRDVPVPVLSMKCSVFDDMGMTGPTRDTDYNETDGDTLVFAGEAHALGAGLRGTVRVSETAAAMTWGRPGSAAVRVAALAADAGRAAIFAYDKGAAMVSGRAPARRIGFFATERLATTWTGDALRLFDASVDWALR